MASKTNDPLRYNFEIGETVFTLVDTPGFGDTRGLKFDKASSEKIKEMVVAEGGFNCVCIVQNGRTPRLTNEISYCYSSLMEILPK